MRYYGSKATAVNTFGKDTKELQAFQDTCKKRLPGAEECLDIMQSTWNNTVKHHEWQSPDKHVSYVPVRKETHLN